MTPNMICALAGCGRIVPPGYRTYCSGVHYRQAKYLLDAPRQQPLRRTFRLRWDASVVIGPDMPAPPRYYAPGETMLTGEAAGIGNRKPFRDDLAAIADRGSPGGLFRPSITSPSMSALA